MDLKFLKLFVCWLYAVAVFAIKVASAFFSEVFAIIFHKIAVLINTAKLIIGIKFCLKAGFITHFIAFKFFTREHIAYA